MAPFDLLGAAALGCPLESQLVERLVVDEREDPADLILCVTSTHEVFGLSEADLYGEGGAELRLLVGAREGNVVEYWDGDDFALTFDSRKRWEHYREHVRRDRRWRRRLCSRRLVGGRVRRAPRGRGQRRTRRARAPTRSDEPPDEPDPRVAPSVGEAAR